MNRVLHAPRLVKKYPSDDMKNTRMEAALSSLSSENKSIFISLFSQWYLRNKKFSEMLLQAPQDVTVAWDQITQNMNNQLSRVQIIEDYKTFLETSTNEAVRELENFQKQLKV
jgi:hypothetical protein